MKLIKQHNGNGLTRVYPMYYSDSDEEWRVEGSYIDLEFYNESGMIAPVVWEEKFMEIYKVYKYGNVWLSSENNHLRGKHLYTKYDYSLRIEWPIGISYCKEDIEVLTTMKIGQRVRLYPRNDNPLNYFDCTMGVCKSSPPTVVFNGAEELKVLEK